MKIWVVLLIAVGLSGCSFLSKTKRPIQEAYYSPVILSDQRLPQQYTPRVQQMSDRSIEYSYDKAYPRYSPVVR